MNKTVVLGLVRAGAFDALGDRGAQQFIAEAYFATTSARKRAELARGEVAPPPPAGSPTPRAWLEGERELLGFYLSAHPSSSIDPLDVERIRDTAEAAEQRRARNEGKDSRDVGIAGVADVLAHERARDSEVRVLPGITSGFAWKANRSGSGGRMIGRIEDAGGGCRLILWAPRETAGREEREWFAALRADPTSLDGAAVVAIGGFSFNATWDKEPGFIADRIEVVGRPEVAAAVAATPVVTPAAADPTRLEGDATATAESLAALFG